MPYERRDEGEVGYRTVGEDVISSVALSALAQGASAVALAPNGTSNDRRQLLLGEIADDGCVGESFIQVQYFGRDSKRFQAVQEVLEDKPKEIVDVQISSKELKPKQKAEMVFQINPKATPGHFQTSLTLDFFKVSAGQDEGKIRCTLPISGTIISE